MADFRSKAFAHLETMRPYTLFHSGLLAVAGAELASGGGISSGRLALAAIATIFGWEAGLYASDYYDRKIDAGAKPDRPIPSGRISPSEALWTMIGFIAAGYVLALLLGWANLGLAILTTVLGIAYSRTFKGRALLGNFDRGFLGICAVAFGALAAGRLLAAPVVLLAALVFFHDSGTNLVGAMRDVEGDRISACRTVPVVYGLRRSLDFALLLLSAWVVVVVVLLLVTRSWLLPWILLLGALVIDVRTYGSLWRNRNEISRPLALSAHKWLVFERLLLLSSVIAAAGPALLAVVLLGVSLAGTMLSQQLLRDRHERGGIVGFPASMPQLH